MWTWHFFNLCTIYLNATCISIITVSLYGDKPHLGVILTWTLFLLWYRNIRSEFLFSISSLKSLFHLGVKLSVENGQKNINDTIVCCVRTQVCKSISDQDSHSSVQALFISVWSESCVIIVQSRMNRECTSGGGGFETSLWSPGHWEAVLPHFRCIFISIMYIQHPHINPGSI